MFFLLPRTTIVLLMVFGLLLAKRLYAQRQRRIRADRAPVPRVPVSLLGASDRTWVVFTTPYCATCGPVTEQLRSTYPDAHVIKVDATRDVALADAFRVRSAPTAVLADERGVVRARLVGAAAVADHVAALTA